MDRQQILDLYRWEPDICFRHPCKGEVMTAPIGSIHPRGGAAREVRACQDCVIAMEDIRRESAARAGGEYAPGQLGKCRG
ncbi:hypothetical protein ACKI1J_14505 [Streptomyces scabiei]|uniref:hypothetical protein n=1 Tax=Streptomyces scabiei TaxID=1930 RepID=UPI0038F73C01